MAASISDTESESSPAIRVNSDTRGRALPSVVTAPPLIDLLLDIARLAFNTLPTESTCVFVISRFSSALCEYSEMLACALGGDM